MAQHEVMEIESEQQIQALANQISRDDNKAEYQIGPQQQCFQC